MKPKCTVRLGEVEWSRHTRAGSVGESLRLLGSVQCGAQAGALAVNGNGDYFQVNGEHVAPLSKRFVVKAVSAAQGRASPRAAPRPSAPAPVVTVRRRRVAIALPPNPDRLDAGD